MKLVDVNVVLYAVNRDEHHHVQVRGWLDRALGETETAGFAWLVLLSFLRVSTRSGSSLARWTLALPWTSPGAVSTNVRLS